MAGSITGSNRLVTGYLSDVGSMKKINQDKVRIKKVDTENGEIMLAIVCDGMGGLSRGDVACNTIVRLFSIWLSKNKEDIIENPGRIIEDWRGIIVELNELIWGYGQQRNVRLGASMSVLLLLPDGTYYAANVGDTRIYHMNKESIHQVIEEPQDASKFKFGTIEIVTPLFFIEKIHVGERFLLCSNGFYRKLAEKDMYKRLWNDREENSEEINIKLERIVHEIKLLGERDNISAIVIHINEN